MELYIIHHGLVVKVAYDCKAKVNGSPHAPACNYVSVCNHVIRKRLCPG